MALDLTSRLRKILGMGEEMEQEGDEYQVPQVDVPIQLRTSVESRRVTPMAAPPGREARLGDRSKVVDNIEQRPEGGLTGNQPWGKGATGREVDPVTGRSGVK